MRIAFGYEEKQVGTVRGRMEKTPTAFSGLHETSFLQGSRPTHFNEFSVSFDEEKGKNLQILQEWLY